jgi:hypothetical protein
MKYIVIPALCVTAVIALCSCSKSYYPAMGPVPAGPDQAFAAFRYTPQTITVNAGKDTVVFGNDGTMLHFYASSFTTATGAIISKGAVKLQLIEMYTPCDMVCNRVTTFSGSQLLSSGGQINVVATMNGQTVHVNKYGVGFARNATTSGLSNMNLFYGGADNANAVVRWPNADKTNFSAKPDSSQQVSVPYGRPWAGFVFDSSSSLEYTNCDAFYSSDSPKVSVSVILPDSTFTAVNTQIYLVLPAINCAMSTAEPELGGNSYNAATKTLSLVSESQTNIVPAGMKYELLVMANKNGKYYYWQATGIVPHNGIMAQAALVQDSQANIKTKLSAL